MNVRPAQTQISLGIRPVWLESSLCTQCVAKDQSFLRADSEDSDQTGRMSRRWVHISFCWFCHVAAQIQVLLGLFLFLMLVMDAPSHTKDIPIGSWCFYFHPLMNETLQNMKRLSPFLLHLVTYFKQISCCFCFILSLCLI